VPDSRSNQIIAIGTIALGIVGIGSLVLTMCSNKINRKAMKAAVIAANAAKESAEAEVAANRAWFIPSGYTASPITGNQIRVEFDFLNAGKVPAFNIEDREETSITGNGTIPDFQKGCPTKSYAEKMPFVLANGTFSAQREFPDWTAGKTIPNQILSIHGCVAYNDVLSNQRCVTEYYFEVFAAPPNHQFMVVPSSPLNRKAASPTLLDPYQFRCGPTQSGQKQK
jgi:hypothetical protein